MHYIFSIMYDAICTRQLWTGFIYPIVNEEIFYMQKVWSHNYKKSWFVILFHNWLEWGGKYIQYLAKYFVFASIHLKINCCWNFSLILLYLVIFVKNNHKTTFLVHVLSNFLNVKYWFIYYRIDEVGPSVIVKVISPTKNEDN